MRVIIAGSRGAPKAEVFAGIEGSLFPITMVLSGCARGADTYGEEWARGARVPVERYPAEWNKYGLRAGYVRNRLMAGRADAVIAIWDGKSNGTRNMLEEAQKRGLRLHVRIY